jgi:hypothetical protein
MIPLGTMKGGENAGAFKYTIPIGWTVGAEVGISLGKRGTVFLDARYSSDFGKVQSDGIPMYERRAMVSITAGYRYGFLKHKEPVNEIQEIEQEGIPDDGNN